MGVPGLNPAPPEAVPADGTENHGVPTWGPGTGPASLGPGGAFRSFWFCTAELPRIPTQSVRLAIPREAPEPALGGARDPPFTECWPCGLPTSPQSSPGQEKETNTN